MKDETVVIIGFPGLWRKTKAHGLYLSGKLDQDRKLNAEKYIASCMFILRYSEERTGMSVNWDAQFARVDNSLKTFTPALFWRNDLRSLDVTSYRTLESALIEENSLKAVGGMPANLLTDEEKSRGQELHYHRLGRKRLISALNDLHKLLTTESFYTIILQNQLRATSSTRARRS